MTKAKKLEISSFAAAEERYLITGERAEDDADWGDPFFDAAIGPMSVGSVYTIAARTNTGKTFVAMRQLLCCQVPSIYIGLEDPMREMGRRAVAAKGFGRKAKERVQLYIPERPRLQIIIQAMRESKARVACIDYLQIIQDDTGVSTFDRPGQVRNILTELKGVLREERMSLLLMAQLKRPPQFKDDDGGEFGPDRKEPRGTVYDCRDSSDIENQSDAVILLHKLGRKKFDLTVEKAKGRCGGDRIQFERGPGGWPIPGRTKMFDSEPVSGHDTEKDPF